MKPRRLAGAPRTVTDDTIQRILAWKPFVQVARDAGVSKYVAYRIRKGYQYKNPQP